eukprot:1157234-Pelagomonas_calceolata.AAC.18
MGAYCSKLCKATMLGVHIWHALGCGPDNSEWAIWYGLCDSYVVKLLFVHLNLLLKACKIIATTASRL